MSAPKDVVPEGTIIVDDDYRESFEGEVDGTLYKAVAIVEEDFMTVSVDGYGFKSGKLEGIPHEFLRNDLLRAVIRSAISKQMTSAVKTQP